MGQDGRKSARQAKCKRLEFDTFQDRVKEAYEETREYLKSKLRNKKGLF